MPTEIGDPRVRAALAADDSELASMLVADLLRDADRLSAAQVGALHCQAAVAAVSCGRLAQASDHLRSARATVGLDASCAAVVAILTAAVACSEQRDEVQLREASQLLDAEIDRNAAPSNLRVRLRLAAMRCAFALSDLFAARAQIAALRAESAAQIHWVESQVLIAEANLALFEERPVDVMRVLAQIEPVVAALGAGMLAASTWWEIAEVARAVGLSEHSWGAAIRALDCSGVRPADRQSSFAPGVLTWVAGT